MLSKPAASLKENPMKKEKCVRPANQDDAEEICSLILRQFNNGIDRAAWQNLLENNWSNNEGEYGWVLEAKGGVVGFIGTVYSEREINGRRERFCNLTTLCVDEEYRGMALSLLTTAIRSANCTVTSISPIPTVARLMEMMGFKALDIGRIIYPPVMNALGLMRGLPRFESRIEFIKPHINEALRQAINDHVPYGCLAVLIRSRGEQCLIVSKKRIKRGVPFSEILFVSSAELFARHLEAIKWYVMAKQCTIAVMGDSRLFGKSRPCGILMRREVLFRSESVAPESIDNLYTELVLIPM